MYNYMLDNYKKELNQLKNNGLPDTLLIDVGFGRAYVFGNYDGCLIIKDNNGNVMNIKEMKELISYLEYSVENLDEDAIIETKIEIIEEKIRELELPKEEKKKEAPIGEVYLIKGENGRYKIGYSKNAKTRLKNLRLSSCEDHILIHKFKIKNPYNKEQFLHKKFKDKRCHSEWFELTDEDVEYIKGFKDEY